MAQNPNPSTLDPGQIVKRAFDESSDRLRVDAEVTATIVGPQEVIISDVDDSIKIGDGAGNYVSVTGGSLDVNITGGGSSGTQYADGAARGTATGTLAMGDDGTNIQSVSVDSTGKLNVNNISGTVSLPTGAATAALQTQPGVDIGDVTVNNASGGAAVNIQDGGNSITVDGTVTSNQGGAPWSQNITQFGSNAVVTGVGNSGSGIPRVTVASDSNIITNASNSIVSVTSTATTALSSNTSRKYVYIFNQSGSTIFIKLGTTAVAGEGIRLVNNSMYEITGNNLWTGTVSLIKVGAAAVSVDVFEGT